MEHKAFVNSLRYQQSCSMVCRIPSFWTLLCVCSRKAILGMFPIHFAHQMVSAKASVELGFEEAMRLGLVAGMEAEESCPHRVTQAGEASV